jgi:hypothetical protein
MINDKKEKQGNFLDAFVQMFQEFFEMIGGLFESDASAEENSGVAEPATASTQATADVKTKQPEDAETVGQNDAPAKTEQPATPLSYNRENNDTSWLDPKEYQQKISVPDEVIAAAKANGEKAAYGIVTVDAGYRIGEDGEKHPYARGFHVFVDVENGNKTLIPMMSGGASAVNASDFANPDAVESTTNAPMPGLLHDTETAIKGVNRVGTLETGDADDKRFGFFMLMTDGKENRSFIGSHTDLIETEKGENPNNAPWGSNGCPVIPKAYEAQYREVLKQFDIGQGDNFYVLDHSAISAIGNDMQQAGVGQDATTAALPKREQAQVARG